MIPGVPGPLCLGHPRHCDTLNAAAVAAGTTLLREANVTDISLGAAPCVSFNHQGEKHTASAPLVVGADGRSSMVRRAAGWNDPIIGQGMSITYRDVRIVSELLLASNDWAKVSFASYGEERRRRVAERRTADPACRASILAAYAGPESVPAETYQPEAVQRLLA